MPHYEPIPIMRITVEQARALGLVVPDLPRKSGRYRVAEKPARTLDGILFDSAAEMRRYAALKLLERIGEIENLELQPAYPVEINGEKFCTYTADFRYRRQGRVVVEDVKSDGTKADVASRLRRKAAELYYQMQVVLIDTV